MIKTMKSFMCSLNVLAFILILFPSTIYAKDSLFDITYGANLFVAAGSQETCDVDGPCTYVAILAASPDGINWIETNLPTDMSFILTDVTYVNNLFVACGFNCTILTSPDGITWTAATVSGCSTERINGITYGNNIFVGLANWGGFVMSLDGIDWASWVYDRNYYFHDIAYGKNNFTAVGVVGKNGVALTSPDGMTWKETMIHYNCRGITYGKDMFVAVGKSGTIVSSSDGKDWNLKKSGTKQDLSSVLYGNNMFVAVGESGTIVTSSDGNKWSVRNPGTAHIYLFSIAYGNGLFVAIGSNDTIMTSPDGITWTIREINS
jgi:hypothetical protein